jgi:DNA-binding Lrp family transcriptional regulator
LEKTISASKTKRHPREGHMVTSFILMNVERTKINEVAEQLEGTPGISEVYSVSGNYDLIAIVRVATNEDLANLVTNKMRAIKEIEKTETMLAFKAYSRHDLESMFSVGM